jgi:hypothetical protein
MKAKLIRLEKSEEGIFGVLRIENQPFCLTLERPWKNNIPNISCVPSDIYLCRRVQSPNFGETFEIEGVPGRSKILFHAGNRIKDSKGCVLLGSEYGELEGEKAVLSSRKAFEKFMKRLFGVDVFALQIVSL